MSRRIGLLLVTFFMCWCTICYSQGTPGIDVQWRDIRGEYASFDEVKPILLNEGDSSVFLSGRYCIPFARIFRLNDSTGQWEPAYRSEELISTLCDTLFEIRAKSSCPIRLLTMGLYGWGEDESYVIMQDGSHRKHGGTYQLRALVSRNRTAAAIAGVEGGSAERSESFVLSESPQFRMRQSTRSQ